MSLKMSSNDILSRSDRRRRISIDKKVFDDLSENDLFTLPKASVDTKESVRKRKFVVSCLHRCASKSGHFTVDCERINIDWNACRPINFNGHLSDNDVFSGTATMPFMQSMHRNDSQQTVVHIHENIFGPLKFGLRRCSANWAANGRGCKSQPNKSVTNFQSPGRA